MVVFVFCLRDKTNITGEEKGVDGVVILLRPDHTSQFHEELMKKSDAITKGKEKVPERCEFSQDWKIIC